MAFSFIEVDQQVNGTTGNTMTFACSFGTASSDRILLAIFTARVNQTGMLITGVTIGGSSATQVTNAQVTSSDNALISDAWYLAVPAGTGGNIVITGTVADTFDRAQCALYAITGSLATPSSAQAAFAVSSASPSVTISVPSNGKAAAAFFNRVQVGSVVWSGATVDATTTVAGSGGTSDCSCAHTTATGSVTITPSDAGGDSSSVLVSVAWASSALPPSMVGISIASSEW